MKKPAYSSSLIEDIRACNICSNLPLGPRPIIQFSSTAKLLIVGQAPGRITHHKGIPFNDPSGDRLRSWLGITKETFYDSQNIAIVPMGFCFPGTGQNGDLPPRPECAEAWRNKVLDQMQGIELTLIIGRYAIDWHMPEFSKQTVTAAVKSSADVWPHKLILPHPSPRNNRWLKQNPWFEQNIIPALQNRVRTMLAINS
ncbi:MAG: uracil-DNA glycosylase family protein [Aliishimia sp.]